jgi:aminoglycoside phosphotransferase (APT) family kinase protein
MGPLLASGRDADVYAIDDDRVLRRYRDGGDVAEEAAVMAYAGQRGVPVPAVYEADGADLVMQRLAGPTLREALLAGETAPIAGAEVLADLHTRLHALPARRSRDPAARILHLDLHPANVILSPRGPMLIDWRNATEGPPDVDVALTALIIAEVAVGSHVPEFAPAARELLAAFLARAGGDPLSQLDRALARRSADSNLTPPEKDRLTQAVAQVRVIGDQP